MSLKNNEFQVYLPSNVKGNPRNKPYLYETKLFKPMNLPGEWNVVLINISFPYNCENFDKSYSNFILILNKPEGTKSEFEPIPIFDDVEIYNIVTKLFEFQGWVVERGPKIARGSYNISKILDLLDFQFQLAFSMNNKSNLNFDIYQYRVEINPNLKFAIACYSERLVLQLLRFGSQTSVKQTPGKRTIEFMIF